MASKRRKRLQALLLILLGAFGIVTLWYCALAFGPTGYKEFEAVRKESAKRVEELLARPLSNPPRVGPPRTFSQALRESGFSYMSLGFRDGDTLRVAPNPDFLIREAVILPFLLSGDGIGYGFTIREGQAPDLRQALSDQHARNRIIQRAWEDCRSASWVAPVAETIGEYDQATLDAFRSYLDVTLPETEAFLLQRNWLPPEPGFPSGYAPIGEFNRGATLAILRAAAMGELEKARRLFLGYLETVNAIYLATLPKMREWTWWGAQDLILTLAETGAFPVEALRDGLAIVEKALLDSLQFHDFRIAHAGRLREDLLDRLQNGRHRFRETTTYHLFADGALENWGFHALLPILERKIDRYAAAFAADPQDAQEARDDLIFWFKAANLEHNSMWPWNDVVRKSFTADPSRDCEELLPHFNKDVKFTLLALGAAIFRKENGRYPDSIAELDSTARSNALADSDRWAWDVCRLSSQKPYSPMAHTGSVSDRTGPVDEIDRDYPVLFCATLDPLPLDYWSASGPAETASIEVRAAKQELICQMRLQWLKKVYGLDTPHSPKDTIE